MKTIRDIYEDQFRITSIPFASSDVVIFTGIPLQKNSYKTNSGVILPFLTAVKSRGYAAINGGLPPLALCGRS